MVDICSAPVRVWLFGGVVWDMKVFRPYLDHGTAPWQLFIRFLCMYIPGNTSLMFQLNILEIPLVARGATVIFSGPNHVLQTNRQVCLTLGHAGFGMLWTRNDLLVVISVLLGGVRV